MTHDDSVNVTDEDSPSPHIPVLANTLIELIRVPRDGLIVDATVGHGGHSWLLGQTLGPEGQILGLDVDPESIERAHLKLNRLPCKVTLVRENFSRLREVMSEQKLDKADLILADLGFCSAQLDDPRRGLSFQSEMPLDMRLDDRLRTTAADLVNRLDEKSLADLIYRYGEDRASRRIARFIVEHRQREPIRTTGRLASIVSKALYRPGKRGPHRIHPATRTFQALRIAVNDEIESLRRLLNTAPGLLKPGGILAVISFHSLEDREVKINFRQNKTDGIYEILTKKPIEAKMQEIEANPRSRSAKLRMARRG